MTPLPRCPVCGDKISTCHDYYKPNGVLGAGTADGKPATRGHNGDNLTCSMICAAALGIRLMRMNPGILKSLPEEWRADKVPWKTWQAGAKLNGKRAWVVDLGHDVTNDVVIKRKR